MSDWWESALLCRETVAEHTVACVLRRPPRFQFIAGQYVELKLPSPAFTDARGATRVMSIASAPSDDDLVLLMRIRDSAFKRSIMMLPAGVPLLLDGPADDLTFEMCSAAPAVLVAGGVGIAPFRALLRAAAAEMCTFEGAVFYSNHRPDDALFLDELSSLDCDRLAVRADDDSELRPGIMVGRHISGGGAVCRDSGHLNFSVKTSAVSERFNRYELFTRPVVALLRALGVPAELGGRESPPSNVRRTRRFPRRPHRRRRDEHGLPVTLRRHRRRSPPRLTSATSDNRVAADWRFARLSA